MTDVPEDWHVRRKRYDAFMATELGQHSDRAYEKALLIDYWQIDADDSGFLDHLMALDEKAKDAHAARLRHQADAAGGGLSRLLLSAPKIISFTLLTISIIVSIFLSVRRSTRR